MKTMNDPSQLLKDEHKIIMQVESTIYAMDFLWEREPEKYTAMVSKLLRFFREYSDRFHHYKEESILFREMRNHPDFMLGEIIDELEEHHKAFRSYTSEITEFLEKKDFASSHKILKKYIHQLLDHIAIEDDEFFNMADQLFNEEEKEKLFFKFMDVDRELGESSKLELEKIPHELQEAIEETT